MNMKYGNSIFLVLFFIVMILPWGTIQATRSEWFSDITIDNEYHWKAVKSELSGLETEERYAADNRESWALVGGINLPNGGIRSKICSLPSVNFNFFNGSRLDVEYTIEGDTGPHLTVNGSDFHLLLLPLRMDGICFFDLLFNDIPLLENLTHSTYLNSSISNLKAVAWFKYNHIHDVKYEWDIHTGFLSRKEVIAPSGLQLVVIPGKGSGFIDENRFISGWSLGFSLIVIGSLSYWRIIKTKR
jgi:hypothetical protein